MTLPPLLPIRFVNLFLLLKEFLTFTRKRCNFFFFFVPQELVLRFFWRVFSSFRYDFSAIHKKYLTIINLITLLCLTLLQLIFTQHILQIMHNQRITTNGESKQELNRNGNNKDNKNHKDNNNRKKGVNFENTATTKNRTVKTWKRLAISL